MRSFFRPNLIAWVSVLVFLMVAAPEAWARGGSRGGGFSRGGGSRGGSRGAGRSSSRGGGSRSFSRGSSRSTSRGSSRSFSRGSARRSTSRGSSRSFSRSSRSSNRSFSRGAAGRSRSSVSRNLSAARASRARSLSRGSSRRFSSGTTRRFSSGTTRSGFASGTTRSRAGRSSSTRAGRTGSSRVGRGSTTGFAGRSFRRGSGSRTPSSQRFGSNTTRNGTRNATSQARNGFARTGRGQTDGSRYGRFGYRGDNRQGGGRHGGAGRHGGRHGGRHHLGHSHFWGGSFWLGYSYGWGPYWGYRYYWPWHNYATGLDYAFFYPGQVTYCYAPYGFYGDSDPYYIDDDSDDVRADYPVQRYETTDLGEAVEQEPGDGESVEKVEPTPAAESPVTERYLREASDAFGKADYGTAAEKFRLASLSSPKNGAPLFALGQALVALKQDAYAARVIRRAVKLNSALLKEPGDIAGVFQSQQEFDRIMGALETRASASEKGSDSRFLLGVERYYSGDPSARETFQELAKALPDDATITLFKEAVEARFKPDADLPPIPKTDKK